MPLEPTWYDLSLRLALAVFAGACVGINREEHGQPAGMRTMILVCVAAAVSMIQANLLLSSAGKTPDSFVTIDLMRLPLGILSGMGFIGAGAIIRRGSMVLGVTTAATLWYVTVMGISFGGGQLGLGLVMLGLGMIVLWALKLIEERLKQDCHGVLRLWIERDALSESQLRGILTDAGLQIRSCAVRYDPQAKRRYLRCDVRWRQRTSEMSTPPVFERLAQHDGVSRLEWTP